jgi:hypothetical protein
MFRPKALICWWVTRRKLISDNDNLQRQRRRTTTTTITKRQTSKLLTSSLRWKTLQFILVELLFNFLFFFFCALLSLAKTLA